MPRKAHLIAPLTLFFLLALLRFGLRSTAWHSESKNEKIFALQKTFYGNNFWLSKGTTFILSSSYFSYRDRGVEWTIIWPQKVMLKIWPQVKVMTWSEKVMLHISRSVSSAWTHLWCFKRSNLSLSKFIAEKNSWWPFITWNDLGDMTRGHWSNIPIQGVKSTSNPMLEWFSSKKGAFQFNFQARCFQLEYTKSYPMKLSFQPNPRTCRGRGSNGPPMFLRE